MIAVRYLAAAVVLAGSVCLCGCVMTEGSTKADVMNSDKAMVTVESSGGKTESAVRNMRLQRWSDAAADLEQAVKDNPADDKAWFALALCCENLGEFQKAEDAYAKANSLVGGAGKSDYVAGYMRMKEKTNKG